MEKIAHRELRNNCGWLWARVAAGESFEITVDDVVTAVISPPQVTPLERLIEDGAVREARAPITSIAGLSRAPDVGSFEVLTDLRRDL